MSSNIKISAVAASVPYDNSATLLGTGTVQSAIDQLALVNAPQFSYKLIQSFETVIIPLHREMVVNNYIEIDGILTIEGDLAIV